MIVRVSNQDQCPGRLCGKSVLPVFALLLSMSSTMSTAQVLHTLISPNEEAGGNFGYSVSGAGDVNGDGYDDVVVGASWEDPGASPEDAGRAYVCDGQTGNLLYKLGSPNEGINGYFGCSVSGAGDVNGDGYDDVVVGAPWEDPGSSPSWAGRAYVFDGQTGNLLHTLVSPNEESSGHFGVSVSGARDVNGDGYDDVVVGAYLEDPGASPHDAGRAYVFDGQTGNLFHTLGSPNEEFYGYFGSSVSGAGDVNGDGYADLVVGAYGEDPGASPDAAIRAPYSISWFLLTRSPTVISGGLYPEQGTETETDTMTWWLGPLGKISGQAPAGSVGPTFSTGRRAICSTIWFLPMRSMMVASGIPFPVQAT